jgi:hypothetical protein
MADDRTGDRRAFVEASPPSRQLGLGGTLVKLSSLRQQREAHTLAEAEKPLRRTLAELGRAQQELARQRVYATASERGSFSVLQHRATLGRDVVRAFAARAERRALLAAQVEYLAACARRNQEAQRAFDDARLRYIKATRKHEQLRRWLRDLAMSGNA